LLGARNSERKQNSSKILVMDEVVANVNPQQANALIQNTIRHKFAECTVLTIAHRLMDSDRIPVMDAGRCVEFAS
jgi:ATP-binding cassette subfamily C (CFTR/MRP) protein 4